MILDPLANFKKLFPEQVRYVIGRIRLASLSHLLFINKSNLIQIVLFSLLPGEIVLISDVLDANFILMNFLVLVHERNISLAHFPEAVEHSFMFLVEAAETVLPSVCPEAFVVFLEAPDLDSVAMLNTIQELSEVESIIIIEEKTTAFWLSVLHFT